MNKVPETRENAWDQYTIGLNFLSGGWCKFSGPIIELEVEETDKILGLVSVLVENCSLVKVT